MPQFFLEENRSNDSELQVKLKDYISSWSNKIPHHDLRNFGELINIKDINYRPVYHFILQTQFENRIIQNEYKPFDGQEIPDRIYNDPSEVDVWAEDFNECDSFINSEESKIIYGSQHVLMCEPCLGEGVVNCPKCGGSKKVECPTCKGKGRKPCKTCGATGRIKVSCSNCGGSGTKSEWDYNQQRNVTKSCGSCSGGRVSATCNNCGGRRTVPCTRCDQTGKIPCSNCRATGKVQCQNCKGRGRLLYYYKLIRSLNFEKDERTHYHSRLKEDFSQLKIDSEYLSGLSVLDQSADLLDLQIFSDADFLSPYFQEMQSTAEAKITDATKLLFQNIGVFKWDVHQVDYEYNDTIYSLLVHGPDNSVLAPQSPITKIRSNFKSDAEIKMKKWKLVESYDLLTKAEQMDVDQEDESIIELKEKAFSRISKFGSFGTALALLVFGYIFWNLTQNFLFENEFFLPYLNELYTQVAWMKAIHPTAVSVFYILLSLTVLTTYNDNLHAEYFKENISSNLLRLILGFITMALFMSFLWIALIVANYAGITLIFTYISYAADTVWHFVINLFN